MGKSWTDTNAPKTGGSNINRVDWRDLKPGDEMRIRLVGDVLPNMIYWVKTNNGNRTRQVCNFNRETEEFDETIDDPIGRIVAPRDDRCRPQFAYVTKCIVRTPRGKPDELKIVELKQTIYNAIREYAMKTEEWGNPADPEEGYDFTIEKKKTGPLPQNVKYIVTPSRRSSPLTAEEQKMIADDDVVLEKLYKQETPPEQLQWLKENTTYLMSEGGIPSDVPEGDGFNPDDDVPF